MEGPGGYFLEPGGYIVDKQNTENQRKGDVWSWRLVIVITIV
jgi:hypothetical protein